MARRILFPVLPLAVLGAASAFVLLRHMPPLLARVLDGSIRDRIDVRGGLRLVFQTTGAAAAMENLAQRARARGVEPDARAEGGKVIVDIPGVPESERDRYAGLLGGGTLAFQRVIDGSSVMTVLAQAAQNDPRSGELGIRVKEDAWVHEGTGAEHRDFYLDGYDRATLERYVASVAHPEPGHTFGYEEMRRWGPPRPGPRRWRTYYLASEVVLDESFLADARVTYDPYANRPEVLITFTEEGRRRFADFTGRNIGRKLAIVVNGQISSAPVIQDAITGGRSTITLGSGDPRVMQREAEDLVGALRAGPIAGVTLESLTWLPARVTASAMIALRVAYAALAGLVVFAFGVWLVRRGDRGRA